jgi:hypothetical protein
LKLIVQSLLVTVVLLAGYHLLLPHVAPRLRQARLGGSNAQQNIAKVQELCYSQSTPDVVILGSSLAANITHFAPLPPRWYEMGIVGSGPLTGAQILLRSGRLPSCVVIESNFLIRPVDQELVSSLFLPGLYQLRGMMPELRQTNQPHLLFLRWLQPPASQPASDPPMRKSNDVFSNEAYQRFVQPLTRPLSAEKLDAAMAALRQTVSELEAAGVQVVFAEFPESSEVMESIQYRTIRQSVLSQYPPTRYAWICPDDPRNYRTSDYLHMIPSSCVRYTSYLVAEVDKARHSAPFKTYLVRK